MLFFSPMALIKTSNKMYTEVVWQWSEELNRMVEVSSAFEDYSGSWGYCAAGDFMDTTSGAGFVPDLWADAIYSFFYRGNKLRSTVDDYSSLVKNKGDSIKIPAILMQDATAKGAGTIVDWDANASSNPQVHDVTALDLQITSHIYQAEIFEDILTIQAQYELISKYAKMFGESLARKVETDLWAELDGFQTTINTGTDNEFGTVELELLLAALYDLDIDPNQCSLVVNHLMMADMFSSSSSVANIFLRNDAYGQTSGRNGAHVSSGAMGLIYGMDVYFSQAVSTGTTARCGAAYVSGACAFAASQDVRLQSQYSVDYLGTKVIADMIYGVKLLDTATNKMGVNLVND